jgi:hypothetical protein
VAEQQIELLKSRAPTLQSAEDQRWLQANELAMAYYVGGQPNPLAILRAGRETIGAISKAMR